MADDLFFGEGKTWMDSDWDEQGEEASKAETLLPTGLTEDREEHEAVATMGGKSPLVAARNGTAFTFRGGWGEATFGHLLKEPGRSDVILSMVLAKNYQNKPWRDVHPRTGEFSDLLKNFFQNFFQNKQRPTESDVKMFLAEHACGITFWKKVPGKGSITFGRSSISRHPYLDAVLVKADENYILETIGRRYDKLFPNMDYNLEENEHQNVEEDQKVAATDSTTSNKNQEQEFAEGIDISTDSDILQARGDTSSNLHASLWLDNGQNQILKQTQDHGGNPTKLPESTNAFPCSDVNTGEIDPLAEWAESFSTINRSSEPTDNFPGFDFKSGEKDPFDGYQKNLGTAPTIDLDGQKNAPPNSDANRKRLDWYLSDNDSCSRESSISSRSKRSAKSAALVLIDDTCFEFLQNRFHRHFLQFSTFRRLRSEFLGPNSEFMSRAQDELLRSLLLSEQENKEDTWNRCSIPYIIVGCGKSITEALMEICHDTTPVQYLLRYVKHNAHNQTELGKHLMLGRCLQPNDDSYWDTIPRELMTLAVPALVTITLDYIDVSSCALTILFGPCMDKLEYVAVGDKEIRTHYLLTDETVIRPSTFPTPTTNNLSIRKEGCPRQPILIRTNDCLILCSKDKPISPLDVKVEPSSWMKNPPNSLVSRSETFDLGDLQGLILGYHFKYVAEAVFWSTHDKASPLTCEIERWRWTSYCCGIRRVPMAVKDIHALSMRNRWSSDHPEFVPWPLTGEEIMINQPAGGIIHGAWS